MAGRSYAGVGVGLGVEAILAGVRGAREVFAMDVHPGSVQAAATHYHRFVGERAGTKFHALVSDLFEGFPDSTQVDVVTFNPPAINERITDDPEMVTGSGRSAPRLWRCRRRDIRRCSRSDASFAVIALAGP